MQRLIVAGIAAVAAGFAITASPASAQALDKINQRGALAVGMKADYKPFGFCDRGGEQTWAVASRPRICLRLMHRLSRQVCGSLGHRASSQRASQLWSSLRPAHL
jgi:ABC-type amino acid transport substrate-binding protein